MADATQVQRRRGTTSQCVAMTPAEAEIIVDTSFDTLRIGDGSRMGGYLMPNVDQIQNNTFDFAVSTGTGNALVLTLLHVPIGYAQPLGIKFRANANNTGAVTVNVNGMGVRNIVKISNGSFTALSANDLISGGIYEITYDGTRFILANVYSSGLISVGQGDLRTSVGTVSGNGTFILPGGTYGFLPITGSNSTASLTHNLGRTSATNPAGSYGAYITQSSAVGNTAVTQQRYITSSPPYDLGDGEVGGFIFVLLDANGDIQATYIADTPPWAYNGPTNITASHKCPVTGQKYRTISKTKDIHKILTGSKVKEEYELITNKIKNADMGMFPHPFMDITEGHRVVLLDPMDDRVEKLIHMQNLGNMEVADIINSKYIKIDNTPLKRSCPKSVIPCKFNYKKT